MRVFDGHVFEFLAGNGVGPVGWIESAVICCREFHEFAIAFVLDDAVDVGVSDVIPDSLRGKVHCESVGAFFEVLIGVCTVVTTATYRSADQTYPKVDI